MGARRWSMVLVPVALLLGNPLAPDGAAEEEDRDKYVDALIAIDSSCKPTSVNPEMIGVHQGDTIRWGVTSECEDNVQVSIEMKDPANDPLDPCEKSTSKQKYKPGKPIKCKVKDDAAERHYRYSVYAGGSELDPEIDVRRRN